MIKHTPGNRDVLRRMQEVLAKKVVKVGYFDTSRYAETGEHIALIAATHEYGSPAERIPPRPTLGPGLRNNQDKIKSAYLQMLKKAIAGDGNVEPALTVVGEVAKGEVQKAIKELTSPPLSPATILARAMKHSKGMASSKPLVDTGQMLGAVNFSVEDK